MLMMFLIKSWNISVMTHDLEPCYFSINHSIFVLSFLTSDMWLSFWSLGLFKGAKRDAREVGKCLPGPHLFHPVESRRHRGQSCRIHRLDWNQSLVIWYSLISISIADHCTVLVKVLLGPGYQFCLSQTHSVQVLLWTLCFPKIQFLLRNIMVWWANVHLQFSPGSAVLSSI